MKKSIFIIMFFLSISGLFVFFRKKPKLNYSNECFIVLNNKVFNLTLAKTPTERHKGLSDTVYLPEGTGKFFVFDNPDLHGFWMKDMNYPIDIIWFDSNLKIVGIAKDTKPETYPEAFYPRENSIYTLEIGSGWTERLNLDFGNHAQLNCEAVSK